MAESQYQFEYDAIKENSLKGSLSPERIGRYLMKAGFDFAYAMDLYLWNARLAKSLQFPLHALEVTLRNAVNHHLVLCNYPQDWAFDTTSLDKLGKASPDLISSLNKSKSRLLWGKMSSSAHYMNVVAPGHAHIPSFGFITTSDVIASMSLEFWTSMLDTEFEYEWRPTFSAVFPNLQPSEYRADLWRALLPIKGLRNRIAHHEPVLDMTTLPDLHTEILNVIGKRCGMTMAWAKHHSTFTRTWHDVPRKARRTGRLLTEIASLCAEVTSTDTSIPDAIDLMSAMKRRDFLVYRADGHLGLLVADDLVRWFRKSMVDSLVEMRSTLAEVVRVQQPSRRIAFVDPLTTTGDARRLFFDTTVHAKDRPTVVLITSDGTSAGSPIGVVFKPDMQN